MTVLWEPPSILNTGTVEPWHQSIKLEEEIQPSGYNVNVYYLFDYLSENKIFMDDACYDTLFQVC